MPWAWRITLVLNKWILVLQRATEGRIIVSTGIATIDKSMDTRNYNIIASLMECKVNYIPSAKGQRINNINMMNDYQQFIGKK